MDLLLSLLTGGNGIFAILGAGLVAAIYAFFRGRKSGREAARAKDADAYERHLQELEAAARARNSVGPDSLPDDKYRRD